MPSLKPSNILRLLPLACLLFSLRAFAQFEIAPDHCDAEGEQIARSAAVHEKTSATRSRAGERANQSATTRALQLKQQIAEQRAVLAQYQAQIAARTGQMDTVLDSLLRAGNKAGDAEALAIYQRELNRFKALLPPVIHAADTTIARLQAEPHPKPQSAGNLHLAKVPILSSQRAR
jgi:DNA anti-recombination protein RmuC